MTPHWIPELEIKDPTEDFPTYEDRIYGIFRKDFIESHPVFDGLRVSVRRQKEEADGKWAGFFHITSVEDHTTGERNVDLHRCERIRYPRQTIDNAKDCPRCHYEVCAAPLIWKNRKYGRDRIYILIESERYFVVLEPHAEKGYCMLVTAYYVDYDHSLRKLFNEYDQACRNGDCLQ